MKPSIESRLTEPGVLVLDGATGTELERRGVPMDGVLWAALAVETHPQIVRQVHEDYLRAGADILTTGTYGASRHALAPAGRGGDVHKFNERAVALAREAVAAVGGDRPVWLAGSISSFIASGDLNLMPSRKQARDSFREQADILAEAGVDILLLEMLRDDDLSAAATEAAVETGLPVWLGLTCQLLGEGPDQKVMLQGTDLREAACRGSESPHRHRRLPRRRYAHVRQHDRTGSRTSAIAMERTDRSLSEFWVLRTPGKQIGGLREA